MDGQGLVTVALMGAGSRGQFAYAPYALKYPHELKFVAVADPDDTVRESFIKAHDIPEENVFLTWQDMVKKPKLADALMICTMDGDHVAPALQGLEIGYRHIMLEKPIDTDVLRCKELAEAAKKVGAVIQICHSLRYTNFYRKLKEILDSGRLGKLVNIAHVEGVGYFHQAHSFVRGNWAKSGETSPMILAKCCHDMDLLLYLTGRDCRALQSYGSLSHFKAENAPEGSADRCLDCAVRSECPYNALKIYGPGGHWHRAETVGKEGFNSFYDMMRHGRLGRCVFRCDNDVVDHQVINMLFEDDITVSMTMSAFSHRIGRETRLMLTGGEIYANLEDSTIEIYEFATDNRERIDVVSGTSGHSGADETMVREFRECVLDKRTPITDIERSVRSHEMAMLAEQARLSGETIRL